MWYSMQLCNLAFMHTHNSVSQLEVKCKITCVPVEFSARLFESMGLDGDSAEGVDDPLIEACKNRSCSLRS